MWAPLVRTRPQLQKVEMEVKLKFEGSRHNRLTIPAAGILLVALFFLHV